MDFNKKYLGVPLAVILILVGIGIGVATSSVIYEKILQGQITVEEPENTGENYEITVYEDQACTKIVESIDFGSFITGQREHSQTYYFKNTGDAYIPQVSVPYISVGADGWGSWGGCHILGPLDVGEVKGDDFNIIIEPDAQPGDYSGEIKIVCEGSE